MGEGYLSSRIQPQHQLTIPFALIPAPQGNFLIIIELLSKFPYREWRHSAANPGLLVYLAVSFSLHSRVS